MRVYCPHCNEQITQRRNYEGPNFCPACQRLFLLPPERPVPPWILGVVVVLMGNWQVVLHSSGAFTMM